MTVEYYNKQYFDKLKFIPLTKILDDNSWNFLQSSKKQIFKRTLNLELLNRTPELNWAQIRLI